MRRFAPYVRTYSFLLLLIGNDSKRLSVPWVNSVWSIEINFFCCCYQGVNLFLILSLHISWVILLKLTLIWYCCFVSQSNIKNSLLFFFLLFSINKTNEANTMQWLIRNSFVPSFRTIDLSTCQRFPFVFYSPIDFYSQTEGDQPTVVCEMK